RSYSGKGTRIRLCQRQDRQVRHLNNEKVSKGDNDNQHVKQFDEMPVPTQPADPPSHSSVNVFPKRYLRHMMEGMSCDGGENKPEKPQSANCQKYGNSTVELSIVPYLHSCKSRSDQGNDEQTRTAIHKHHRRPQHAKDHHCHLLKSLLPGPVVH